MALGPYASFIVTSYVAATLVVMILIAWIVVDYRSQTRRLRELDESGIARRSGRSATELS
ncbi:MAG: heme exporter protein CcmD [Bradyrhizobium sp.]|uniref:heme exporter protein CcmD n=1 Tax=Bradyrhizobium sp. TaxID=376 RepID=UPI001D215F8C|nr:heme exporter protein CcmD [Bradyrhizobium sp.]MBV9563068.1 heme exporter protein CcmD [Bradyrhizobium sp.]